MARPPLDASPLYARLEARAKPLKNAVEQAKADAARDVQRAKDRVEAETLAIVKEAIDGGLSAYAVGKLTGKTSAKDRAALIERAMGTDWVAQSGGYTAPDTEVFQGWTWGPQVVGGWTPFVSPEGDRYEVGFNAGLFVEWHKPDGSVMSHDERNELPLDVEMFAHEKVAGD